MSQDSTEKNSRPGLKRKLKTHTIETKFQAIADVEKGRDSKAAIAKKCEIPPAPYQRGSRMPRRSMWPTNRAHSDHRKRRLERRPTKTQTKQFCNGSKQPETKMFQCPGPFSSLKHRSSLLSLAMSSSAPLGGSSASKSASQLGDEFKCTNGWLERFKERHNITFKRECGESKAINEGTDQMTEWSSTLQTLLGEYSHSDIFNADEMDCFIRLLPDKTLEYKGVDCLDNIRALYSLAEKTGQTLSAPETP
ncbi:tigger transposable element-derived protein 4-like [Saccostrea cucullata]|uniref:tigger transposable element-derived protein 4-like n=1 Tax=Saccostrea cuccullata TaxID=36930 RepID=UPI002ED17FF1